MITLIPPLKAALFDERGRCDEEERLVAASLEPGVGVSEVARMAGFQLSQLVRWKELCGTLKQVAVRAGRDWIVCAAPGPGRIAIDPDGGVDGRAMASSRLILVSGTPSGSMATLMQTRYVLFSMLWSADDPGSDGRASVARDRLHGDRRGFPSPALHVQRRCCARSHSAVICLSSAVATAIL